MLKKLQALKAKKGFTLVELIVVIAIIGVLAAILIPTLSGVIESSRKRGVESTNSSIQSLAKAYCSQYTAKTGADYMAAADETVDMDDGNGAVSLADYIKNQVPELKSTTSSTKREAIITIVDGKVTGIKYTEGSYISEWDNNAGLKDTVKGAAPAATAVTVNASASST